MIHGDGEQVEPERLAAPQPRHRRQLAGLTMDSSCFWIAVSEVRASFLPSQKSAKPSSKAFCISFQAGMKGAR